VSNELEESFVIDMLLRGREQPAKVLAENAGTEADVPFSLSRETVPVGFKRSMTGHSITPAGPGIFDSFAVVATALHYALTGVAQALTVDTVVLRRFPDAALRP
jgi:hypothetical protein